MRSHPEHALKMNGMTSAAFCPSPVKSRRALIIISPFITNIPPLKLPEVSGVPVIKSHYSERFRSVTHKHKQAATRTTGTYRCASTRHNCLYSEPHVYIAFSLQMFTYTHTCTQLLYQAWSVLSSFCRGTCQHTKIQPTMS